MYLCTVLNEQNMTLSEILRDSDYRQSQFNLIQIHEFEQKITVKADKNGKEQLKSYCNATGAPIGVWTNGESGRLPDFLCHHARAVKR